MHTEEEAKTTWCPFSRCTEAHGGNRPGYGSIGDGPVEDDYCVDVAMMAPCIGSACMAWRWVYALDDATHPSGGNSRRTNSGYCGLAGTP